MTTTTTTGIPLLHADHGVGEAHMRLIDALVASREGFFIEVLPLGTLAGTLQSALYGPSAGDEPVVDHEVEHIVRGERKGPSRLVNRPTRPADHMVVIGVGGDDAKVFTAYGNIGDRVAPREPWDPSMTPAETSESIYFWAQHALAREPVRADAPATPEVIAALIGGAVPEGWGSVPGVYTNLAEAGPEARAVIEHGVAMAQQVWMAWPRVRSKADNRDIHPFDMEPNSALSKSLQEQGWVQWHSAVQTRSKEECAAEGVKYKRYRYAVHVWISPKGETALGKVKLQGKEPLDA